MLNSRFFCVIAAALFLIPSFIFAQEPKAATKDPAVLQRQKALQMRSEVDNLEKELNLSPEQKAKLAAVRSQARLDTEELIKETRLKMRDIVLGSSEKILALLNDKQKEKFKNFQYKYGFVFRQTEQPPAKKPEVKK